MRVDDLVTRLDGVKRKSSGGWIARCPAHEDTQPSLSIDPGSNGKIVMRCFAGCEVTAIVAAMGLSMTDLFDDAPEPVAVASNGHAVTTWYDIRDQAGVVVARHKRVDQSGAKKMSWWLPEARQPGLGGLRINDLPLYGMELFDEWSTTESIIVCEGEKAALALQTAGVPALGTATGANGCPDISILTPLAGRTVILWPDNDAPGRIHMERVGKRLTEAGATCRWFTWTDAPAGGDAADYLATRTTAALRVELSHASRWPARQEDMASAKQAPAPFSAVDLMAKQFAPLLWVVPDLLPEGGAILSGKSKQGKSWIALSLSVAVAYGGRAFGKIAVEQGEVLVLALEDGDRRLQRRLRILLADAAPPVGWFGQVTWPTLDRGGLDALDAWLTAHPRCRLVIIDTLKKFRPVADTRQTLYNTDYDALGPLTELGQRHRCCVLTIHHSTKAAHADFVDELSGSIGLSGASETILGFRRDRGSKTATLLLAGRDLDEERELSLQWDGLTGQWVLVGDAKEVAAEKAQQATAMHQTWLRETLATGRKWSSELFEAAKVAGIGRDDVFAAKDVVGAQARKDGHGQWYWELSR